MSKTPEPPTPATGGCYYADPKTGELRRDGHTPQTREGDLAPVRVARPEPEATEHPRAHTEKAHAEKAADEKEQTK